MSPRIYTDDEHDDEDVTPVDNLPDGTKRVVNRHGELTATVREEWFDPEWFDLDFETTPSQVVFEEGDEIPLPLAGMCYDAFGDALECQDGNGATLDPATAETTGQTFPR